MMSIENMNLRLLSMFIHYSCKLFTLLFIDSWNWRFVELKRVTFFYSIEMVKTQDPLNCWWWQCSIAHKYSNMKIFWIECFMVTTSKRNHGGNIYDTTIPAPSVVVCYIISGVFHYRLQKVITSLSVDSGI